MDEKMKYYNDPMTKEQREAAVKESVELMQKIAKEHPPLTLDAVPMDPEEEKEYLKRIKAQLEKAPILTATLEPKWEPIFSMYQMIADENELRWFFEHVIQRPQVNESYSAVFVSRHKKLTKEEQEAVGLTRSEAEFLSTVTFKLRNIKDGSSKDDPSLWTFEQFLSRVKRFNVDKGAYTTATGQPIPEKTLAIIFYVNPGDDMKVCKKFVDEYNLVNEGIAKAMLNGKTTAENYQCYQWFGNAESTIKHLKANQKGSRYWMDFDIDVPKWFKAGEHTYSKKAGLEHAFRINEGEKPDFVDSHGTEVLVRSINDLDYETIRTTHELLGVIDIGNVKITKINYEEELKKLLTKTYGKGSYVIIDTSGGYHVLVKTSAIKSNPHDICQRVESIYEDGIKYGEEPYLDEKSNCKFECIVNDSQIPGLPLPGTYQYGRPVTVLNKEDFE